MPACHSPVQSACPSLFILKFTQTSFRVSVNYFPFSYEIIENMMPAQAANVSAEGKPAAVATALLPAQCQQYFFCGMQGCTLMH